MIGKISHFKIKRQGGKILSFRRTRLNHNYFRLEQLNNGYILNKITRKAKKMILKQYEGTAMAPGLSLEAPLKIFSKNQLPNKFPR